MNKLIKKLEPINLQLKEIYLGCHPKFIWEHFSKEIFKTIPVFIFHTVKPKEFEEKLRFLKENSYSTITAEDVYQILTGNKKMVPKSIMLTFDDGRKSVWSTAFPLLKKYGFNATAFIIPGLINDENTVTPNLDDIGKKDVSYYEIENYDKSEHPLISWKEAEIMHKSGIIDIQCHTNYHMKIPVGPKIESFIHPDIIKKYFFNFEIPLMQGVYPQKDKFESFLGAPIYQSSPSHLNNMMYIEDINLRKLCIEYVKENGGEKYFLQKKWEQKLKKATQAHRIENDNSGYELKNEMQKRIYNDFLDSKMKIEKKISGKEVRHLSFPWGIGSDIAIKALKDAGYVSAYWRIIPHKPINKIGDNPFKIVRLKHDFIFRLPGKGRKSLSEVFGFKFIRRIKGEIDY